MKVIKNSVEIKIPRTLNEHILGKCNMEYPEKAPEVVGAVSVDYAKAIKDRQDLEKKSKEDFKDQDKIVKEFVKKNANIDLKEYKLKALKNKNSLKEGLNIKLYKRAEQLADELDNLIAELGKIENIDEYLTSSDFNHLNKASEALQDFAVQYSFATDNEDVFEGLTEEEEVPKNNYSKKKEPREKKTDLLRNQLETDVDELWLDIYDELDATTSPGFVKDMERNLTAKKGERYNQVLADQKDPYKIWVYGMTPEDFDFARKVSDYYGVVMDEPELPGESEKYYKLRAGIHVDQKA